ncbi:hypothetical protein Sros01_04450 [Streptomyces roseochromogenus]|nr:hypothetical protein Sros01_04450 [Streptomyces roseochromogenus]
MEAVLGDPLVGQADGSESPDPPLRRRALVSPSGVVRAGLPQARSSWFTRSAHRAKPFKALGR